MSSPAPEQPQSAKPMPIKIVGLDIPMADLFVHGLKLIVIGFFLAIPIYAVLFLMRIV